LFHR
jgi:hypothetical protein